MPIELREKNEPAREARKGKKGASWITVDAGEYLRIQSGPAGDPVTELLEQVPEGKSMIYKLSVHQRLVLLNILPQEGDLTTIRLVRELREDLSFSEDEHAALNFQHGQGNVRWNDDVVDDKDIDIGPKAADVVRKALGELDKNGKLREGHLSLVDTFEYEG